MRPERDNIAAPDLPAGLAWIGEEPRSMPVLTAAGPVLVHFFDYAQLNSVRTLPYLIEWDRRYREAGLRTIGVQSPRFPFGADPVNVAAGLGELGVDFPVAIDAEHDLWHPTVSALGVVGIAPVRDPQIPNWYGAVGVNINVPVFNGFLYNARAKTADLQTEILRQRLVDLRNNIARRWRCAD